MSLAPDPVFLTLLVKACKERKSGREDALIDAFDALPFVDFGHFRSYGCGRLETKMLNPDHVKVFVNELVAKHPSSGLPNDAETVDVVYHFVKRVRVHLGIDIDDAADPLSAAAGGAAGKEPITAVSVYKDAYKYHNMSVKISDRATFVVDARKSYLEHGYITELPSIRNVKCLGVAGGGKRKLGLAGGADVTATLDLDEGKPRNISNVDDAKKAAQVICEGLLAVYAAPISASAFGGGDEGWVTVPGEAKQVRLGMSRAEMEKLKWTLCQMPFTEPMPYIRAGDGVLKHFVDESERKHADAVINNVVDQRSELFRTDPGAGGIAAEAGVIESSARSSRRC